MNLSSKHLLLAAVALVALFIPDIAHAFPFTVPESDKSREWFIKGLFGGLDGGGSDPLASIIEIFNGAVLCIGGILLFYTLIAGTMQTAHDGEVLGRKWSSLWLPLRTALGVAAIIPGPQGYAIVQHAVIWLALQGVGIADQMQTTFIDSQEISGYTVSKANIKGEIETVVRSMVMNSACVAAFDDDIASNDALTNGLFGMSAAPSGNINVPPPASGTVMDYFSYRYGCGFISHDPYELPDDNENAGLQIINMRVIQEMRKAVWMVHSQQKTSAISQAGQVGVEVVKNYKDGVTDEATFNMVNQRVDAISDAWATAVADEVQSRISSLTNKEVIQKIKEDGWILLGSIYIQITLGQQAVSEAMGIVPNVSVSDRLISASNDVVSKKDEGAISAFFSGLVRKMHGEEWTINEQSAGAILYSARATNAGVSTQNGETSGSGAAKQAMTGMTGAVVKYMTGVDMSGSDKNPVLLAGEMGNRITNSVFFAFAILTAASLVASIWPGLGTTVAVLGAIISPLMLAMLGAGLSLSYYIPMIPYILWLGAVFGWVVLIVEAVIAAPIWAVTHLSPDADGIVGKGGQGYMLVLSLTLRPALMVFGFAAAAAVMKPMGIFLNETFMATFFASTSPGMTGFLRILAGSVIYASLMMMVINRVFSLIHQIPDGILRWIGGGDNVIGREASEANAGGGKALAAGAAVGSALSSANGGAQQIGANIRSARDAKNAKLNASAATAAQGAGNAADTSTRTFDAASNNLSALSGSEGSSGFEEQASGVKQQADSAAMAAVTSAEMSAQSTIANDKAMAKDDPLRPSKSDVEAAKGILSSIDSSGAKSSPAAARKWLNNAAGEFSGSRFGPQLGSANASLSSIDGKLDAARKNHAQMVGGRSDSAAMSAISGIESKAQNTIERAGILSGDDPDFPTQGDISAAADVLRSIQDSGAKDSPEAARSWLDSNSGKYEGTSFGSEIGMAAARASKGSASGSGRNNGTL